MAPLRVCALVASALFAAGCGAGNKNAADQQFEELHAEITKLQQEQDRMGERLAGVESKTVDTKRQARPGERPPLDVVVLRPETDQTTEEPTAEPEDDSPRQEVRLGREAKGKKAKGDVSSKDAEREYEAALSLVKKKSYEKAIDGFTGFLVKFPDHARADAAMFWMGEAYLGKGDVQNALAQLDAVVARFPDGNKAPDALLKIALIRKKAGEDEMAKATLARLRARYPGSDAAKRAPKEQ